MVMLSPLLMLPSCVRHNGRPVFTSTAMVWPSRVLKMYLPLSTVPPRFTTSQHATPWLAGAGFGENDHFNGAPGFVRSSA